MSGTTARSREARCRARLQAIRGRRALNLAGVVSGWSILRGWRIAVLIATLFAALATPAADVVSMLMLGGMLIVLFFAAAGLSLLFDRRKRRRGVLP